MSNYRNERSKNISKLWIFILLKLPFIIRGRNIYIKIRIWWILVCRTTIYIKSIRRYIVLFILFMTNAAKQYLLRINQLSVFFHRLYTLHCANTCLRIYIMSVYREKFIEREKKILNDYGIIKLYIYTHNVCYNLYNNLLNY